MPTVLLSKCKLCFGKRALASVECYSRCVCVCLSVHLFFLFFFWTFSLCVCVCPCMCVCVCACVYDEVSGSELIGHMSAQMSSLFNKAGELNCHYCQHLTVVLPARWYLVIYHNDELSQITLY